MPDEHIELTDQSDSSSPIRGLIEKSTLRYNRIGKAEVTISGWLLYNRASIVILQFALPGSEVTLARRIDRPDIGVKFPTSPGSYNSGFNAVLQLSDRSEVLTDVYFTAILDNGLIVAGALELPKTSIQSSAHNFFIEKGKVQEKRDEVSGLSNIEKNLNISSEEMNTSFSYQEKKDDHSKTSDSSHKNSVTSQKKAPKTSDHINESLVSALKESHRTTTITRLVSFLASDERIIFKACDRPKTSILLILYNRAELTLECLKSIRQSESSDYEIIVIDNASTDYTQQLLQKIEGVTIVTNTDNKHFVEGVNQAASISKGENILLLNNDTTITPSSISYAEETLDKPGVGAVGSRIIKLDGTLQEAGCFLLSNAKCHAYGSGEDPLDFRYLFERSVDYCSGAFLLTKRSLFNSLGGLDASFAPAYFEDVDYCVRLSSAGYEIKYDPRCVVIHVENGSSSKEEAKDLQVRNRNILIDKHGTSLQKYFDFNSSLKNFGRASYATRKKVLVIDDVIPFEHRGGGSPRTKLLLSTLSGLDVDVTFFSTLPYDSLSWHYLHGVIPINVECVPFLGKEKLPSFLNERADFYDTIVVSRPHNMEYFQSALEKLNGIALNAEIIYDVESLYAEREIHKMNLLNGTKLSDAEKDYILSKELDIAKTAHKITVVSDKDAATFKEAGFSNIEVISYGSYVHNSTNSFEDRSDILFVGPIRQEQSANLDAIRWFIHEVLPILREKYDFNQSFRIIGDYKDEFIKPLQVPGVWFHGPVKELSEIYNMHRIAVAPVRYAAGISLKVIEAASHGLPVVATDLITELLGWVKQEEIASISSPEGFAYACHVLYTDKEIWEMIRENAFKRIDESYSLEGFTHSVKKAFLPTRL
jgi:GT2 family glycosyltransferase